MRIENPCMGVPITFLGKHNPEQFEIVGQSRALATHTEAGGKMMKDLFFMENEVVRTPYMRIVIRRAISSSELRTP